MFQVPRSLGGFFVHFSALSFVLGLMTALHRYLILRVDFVENYSRVFYNPGQRDMVLSQWWQANRDSILAGVGSDALFVLAAAAVLSLLRPALMLLIFLVLALFYAANIEHIHFNFAHVRLGTIGFAFDGTFIKGSGTTPDFIRNLAFLVQIAILGWLALRWRQLRIAFAPAGLAVLGAAILLSRPLDPLSATWMQTHPLALRAPAQAIAAEGQQFDGSVFQLNPPIVTQGSGQTRHNILIVYLEGVSHYSLAQGEMTYLQRLGQDNLQFTRYFGTQLLTSNGLYASLTGAMPNFLGPHPIWDTMQDGDPETREALPRVLRGLGYRTAFLQSANLSYMSKDIHLRQLGFEDVNGREHWSEFRLENGWGIDDDSLFRNALGYIDGLQGQQPWMVSLLTVGTHAPYLVPEDFMPDLWTRYRALRQADLAVEALMDGLRVRGLLENTVVIITADESREPGKGSNIANEIVLNWLPLIVVHPNGLKGVVDWPIAATQLRDLALIASGDSTRKDIDVLRRPDIPLVFGNYLSSRVFWYDKEDERFYACFTQDFLCAEFQNVADVTALDGREPSGVFRIDALRKIFATHETDGRP